MQVWHSVSVPQYLEEGGRSIINLRWFSTWQIKAILGNIRPCLNRKEIRYIWITEYRTTKLFSDHGRETNGCSQTWIVQKKAKHLSWGAQKKSIDKEGRWHSKRKCHRIFPELVANIKLDVEITLNLYNENKLTSLFFISLRPGLYL